MRTISAQELYKMIQAGEKMIIVDCRSKWAYDEGHIKGAINLPVNNVEQLAPKLIPRKETELILYCGSAECYNSIAELERLEELSYKNLLHFEGGLEEWVSQGYILEKTQK